MDRRRYLALCTASVGILAGCGTDSQSQRTPTPTGSTAPETTPTERLQPTDVPPLDGNWSSYQHDAANTGATEATGPVDEPVERWARATTAGAPATSPAAADGTFVVVTRTGTLYARDADDGSIRWSRSLPVNTDIAPATGEGIVVAGGQTLFGFDVDSGGERWTASLEAPVVGLEVLDGRVVVATETGIRALALADGTAEWGAPIDETVVTPPGVGSGVAAVGVASESVVAVDVKTGQRRWDSSLGAEPTFAPAVGHGNVYLEVGPRLVAFERDGGDQQWVRETDHPIATSPAVTADAVYVTTLDDDAERPTPQSAGEETPTAVPTDTLWLEATVMSLFPDDGNVQWRVGVTETYNFTSGPPAQLPLVVADDNLVVGLGGALRAYDTATGDALWSTSGGGVVPSTTAGVVSTGAVGLDSADGSVRWRFGTTDNVSPPVVVDNTVYVGSDDTYLYALAANAGSVRWSARTDGPVRSTPAVGAETVYAGTMDGTLYAFDRADGTERWTFEVGGQVQSPTLQGETLYVGNFSPTLTAVDAADGTETWRTEVGRTDGTGFVALTTAATDETVFAGSNGDLRAFDTADGTERWRVTAEARPVVQSPPVAAAGYVLVNMGDSLRAYDATDGTERWARSTGGSKQPPVVRDGTVYASGDGTVSAFDLPDGTRRWRTSVSESLTLVAGDGAIYGLGFETPFVALDPSDGSVRWRRETPSTTPPAIADDYVFVGGESGTVYALGPASQ